VAEALESIAAQVFTDFEVLVVDDGSTDDSPAAISPFLSDTRFKYIRQENAGVGAARNHALRLARGEWFAQLDGDDVYLPNALSVLSQLADSDPKANLVYANVAAFREDGYEQITFTDSSFKQGDITEWLYAEPHLCTNQAMVRTDDLRSINGYEEHLPALEDYDLWLRLAHHGVWAASRNEMIARYRIRPGSKTSNLTRNARLMAEIAESAAERETRTHLARVLRRCARVHWSRYELHQARDMLIAGEQGAEEHLWRSFRMDMRQKRVFLSAVLCEASRLTRSKSPRGLARKMLDGAFDMPWAASETRNEE
jgi:glycosyltransferase involved in cell wall biosynthesis